MTARTRYNLPRANPQASRGMPACWYCHSTRSARRMIASDYGPRASCYNYALCRKRRRHS